MIRLIKRYGSRKLYDTEESRYVSLDEIGDWVRQGQKIRVIDNKSGEDVTATTLTQVILEDGKKGTASPPTEILHELIRRGNDLVSSGVEQAKQGLDVLVEKSMEHLGPVKEAREETDELRRRLDELERSLRNIEATKKKKTPVRKTASRAR